MPPAAPAPTPRRLDTLTGMRAVAALAVVLLHTLESPDTRVADLPWLRSAVALGALGVPFFFALSGFVLTWSARPGDRVRDFYQRRAARVLPLHVATWAVACVAIVASGTSLPLDGALLSLLLLQSWVPDTDVYFAANGPSWSLSCEAFFYALTPFLLVPVARRGRVPLVLAGAVALMLLAAQAQRGADAVFERGFDLFVFPPFALGAFLVGMCCATAMRAGWRPRAGLRTAGAATVVTVAVLTALHHATGLSLPFATVVFLAPVALLLCAAADRDLHGAQRSLLARPAVVTLGEWSFALYLVHSLLLRALVRVLGWTPPQGLLANVLVEVVVVLAAVALAGLAHVLLERPLERRLRPARRAPAAVTA